MIIWSRSPINRVNRTNEEGEDFVKIKVCPSRSPINRVNRTNNRNTQAMIDAMKKRSFESRSPINRVNRTNIVVPAVIGAGLVCLDPLSIGSIELTKLKMVDKCYSIEGSRSPINRVNRTNSSGSVKILMREVRRSRSPINRVNRTNMEETKWRKGLYHLVGDCLDPLSIGSIELTVRWVNETENEAEMVSIPYQSGQ
jgi:hypothetical protein